MAASLAVVAGTFVASPAMADSHPGPERRYGSPLTTAAIAAGDASIAKIRDLGDALTTIHGSVHFDAALALERGAAPVTVREVAVGIVAGGGAVSGITVDDSKVLDVTRIVLDSRCAGVTNYSTQWFGRQLKLNSCDTSRLIAALAVGAGIATLAAIVTAETGVGAIAGGVIAALLSIGAGAIAFCAADGNGVIVDQSWTGAPWCAGQ
ncbi:putative integral membrane protein [Clavibacter sepedonicus]|uniref:Integral membrane protein n=2 Tax=Microbacteriaceae TaxID=85023 RepID=B0RE07_CLASE|nr:putative integral membrane protein [Clavibacter sepedonicus]